MRILSATLSGFTRLKLNQIETISITMTEPLQLILGSNGSGKSSLIAELFPLPADRLAYTKTGSKTITYEHLGKQYVLTSEFNDKNKTGYHTFTEDGVPLNDKGTASQQRELAEKYFGITEDVRKLLTGQTSFCAMKAPERRYWFTKLSPVNYDYALKVYASLKDRARDITGALKLEKKRIVIETEKVITPEHEARLKAERDQLHNDLMMLMEVSAPPENTVAYYEQIQEQGLRELHSLSHRLLHLRCAAPNGRYFSGPAEIDGVIADLQSSIKVNEALLNSTIEEHDKLQESAKILKLTGEDGVKTLVLKRAEAESSRHQFLGRRTFHFDYVGAAFEMAVNAIYETLTETLDVIPTNEERKFSSARLAQLTQEHFALVDKRNVLRTQITGLVAKRNHLDEHRNSPKTFCPACGHGWIQGFSEALYGQVSEDIGKSEIQARLYDEQIAKLEEEIREIQNYAELYRRYTRCVNSQPLLKPFWDLLTEEDLVVKYPKKARMMLDQLVRDIELTKEADQYLVKMRELTALISAAEQVGDLSLSNMTGQLTELTHRSERINAEIVSERRELRVLTEYRTLVQDSIALGERVNALRSSLEQNNAALIETTRREMIRQCIRHLQSNLAKKNDILGELDVQKGIVQDIQMRIELLTVEEIAAKALVVEMSPTDGLIAEGLLGFIRNYTGRMNAIIEQIWAYRMEVQDCVVQGGEDAELDYNFPLLVVDEDNPVPDVAMASAGQKEIVNLAFNIVAMHYLGLDEAPLYLDEFAAKMDAAHRSAAVELIKNLMEQQPFTQLFMISHDYDQYGAFPNKEVCVLHANNIIVPDVYNEHVTIT